jgi:ribonuclease P/MRP protein subunit POP7
LLVQISKRSAQSSAENRGRGGRGKAKALEANGRLEAKDVEASIADAAAAAQGKGKGKGKNVGGEEVYLKATGRAIPRALELGVKFQGEEDCRVRVEMGNVKAIDDVDIKEGVNGEEVGEDVPETRIRTLSTVTVCIGLE